MAISLIKIYNWLLFDSPPISFWGWRRNPLSEVKALQPLINTLINFDCFIKLFTRRILKRIARVAWQGSTRWSGGICKTFDRKSIKCVFNKLSEEKPKKGIKKSWQNMKMISQLFTSKLNPCLFSFSVSFSSGPKVDMGMKIEMEMKNNM